MSYLLNNKNQKIAYKKTKGNKQGIVFIHGYGSDMEGEKAKQIEKFAKKEKVSFVRFDLRGHGKSDGQFDELLISDWKNDVIDIIDKITTGKQVLVGSSLGGWLMILAAKRRVSRIKGIIGLAAAPDFTKDIYSEFKENAKKKLNAKGHIKIKKWGLVYNFTKKFFIDGKKNFVLNKKFNFRKPMILIHGIKDEVVSLKKSFEILNNTTSKNIILKFIKNGDHRLSSKGDIKIILSSIKQILKN